MRWIRLFNDKGTSIFVNFFTVMCVNEHCIMFMDSGNTGIRISGDDQAHIQEVLHSSEPIVELKCEGSLELS